jgi:nicotinamide-nucleotide amidase
LPKSSSSNKVESIVIGNELLNGTVLDTNSHWLSSKLNDLGLTVARKTTIPDNLAVISKTFKESLQRKPDWIFSIGGLGPTFDDMTLQGLAKAIGVRVERNPKAVQFLKQSWKRRSNKLARRRISKASLKMAEIPKGTVPLANPVGSAPAVLAEMGSTRVVSFPGVPVEMKGIFKQHVLPILRRDYALLSKRKEIWISSVGIGESLISRTTSLLMRRYSGEIYLKSHPIGFDNKGKPLLRFQLISMNSLFSDRIIEAAARYLEKKIQSLGAKSMRISMP